jgi:hypothetical protein
VESGKVVKLRGKPRARSRASGGVVVGEDTLKMRRINRDVRREMHAQMRARIEDVVKRVTAARATFRPDPLRKVPPPSDTLETLADEYEAFLARTGLPATLKADELAEQLKEAPGKRSAATRAHRKYLSDFIARYKGAYVERENMLWLIQKAWTSGKPKIKETIWAESDSYGKPGHVPPQGHVWSGVRDSSTPAVKKMHAIAQLAGF